MYRLVCFEEQTMKEETLSSRQIFKGRIVNLAVHTVLLPDGKTTQRELIKHSGAVAIVAVNAEQQILLVKQYRIGAGREMYEIPAGLLEPGENPRESAERELREETGCRPTSLESLGGLYAAPGYTTEYIHLFYAPGYERAPLSQDADEFVESLQLPLLEALNMVERGEINEAKSVIGILRVARNLRL